MKLLLIYPPFCTPISPPYSITGIATFLKNNLKSHKIKTIDLNIEFHNKKFKKYQKYFSKLKDLTKYNEITKEYSKETTKTYRENNLKVRRNEKPEYFKELLNKIKKEKPDYCAFSIVYSSQVFYTFALIKELKELNIKTIVGGPAINKKLKKLSDHTLNNELELLELIKGRLDYEELDYSKVLDFSQYKDKYFAPEQVLPLKTCNTCYYQQCAFCTHHKKQKYFEFDIKDIQKTITKNKAKYIFFIDDMIHKNSIQNIAKLIKKGNIKWMCQLKPTKDYDKKTLRALYDAGLRVIIWGVESGSDKILKLMRKGTNTKDIKNVLKDSHEVGIKNVVYIMFGFPTETKDDFLKTIEFLKTNHNNIDLISTSIFGLQKNTDIYKNPKKYSITKIKETKRQILENKIDYEVNKGLTNNEAKLLRKKYSKTLEKINKYPKQMNFFREHMLFFD